VTDVSEQSLVIDVSGVGYLLYTPGTFGVTCGEEVTVHTYLAVRENALDLYGFANSRDLAMFRLLIDLPKIGPKTGLQILAQANTELIYEATLKDDATYLAKMSGIGKKTAEKIVAGLKDKLEILGMPTNEPAAPQPGGDAVDALIALGYSPRDVREALADISSDLTDTNAVIKEALKSLSS